MNGHADIVKECEDKQINSFFKQIISKTNI